MTETLWRITKRKYTATCFSGIGASLAGGRWNSQGMRVVYASPSKALAMLEILVRLDRGNLAEHYDFVPFELPTEDILDLDESLLPNDWKADRNLVVTQEIGDAWLESRKSVALRVPSAIVAEYNVLINPMHRRFTEAIIGEAEPCEFDQRVMDLITRSGFPL